ncbi:MAG: hypothetical protein PHY93_19395 [Bacteriovorax sp.]|nr:hypothetical protein [Bacteriovorax sp.]
MKLKYLHDIQKQVDRCESLAAQKKLVRYQAIFKFKEKDEESILYYSILFQIGSCKLLQKLILSNLDSKILSREKLDQETILKMIIWARVLACQGAFKISHFILSNIKNPAENISTPAEGLLLYKSLFSVFLFDGDVVQCLLMLEKYISYAGQDSDKAKKIFYLTSKASVYFLIDNIKLAKSNLEELLNLVEDCNSRFQLDNIRILQFAVKTMEGVLDEEGYLVADSIYQYTLNECYKFFVKIVQLKYLILLNDKENILKHIVAVYDQQIAKNSEYYFFNEIVKTELQSEKYQNYDVFDFRLKIVVLARSSDVNSCIEWTGEDLRLTNYLSSPLKNNQLDLLAGVVNSPEGVFFLTELQRICLHSIVTSGHSGVNWLILSELMYGADLNFSASFENVRKIITKLRSLKMHITYTAGRYFFQNNFTSILFTNKFLIGDQLLYIRRCSGKSQLTAGDFSKLLELKKSRTNEYLQNWLKLGRLSVIASKGSQVIYQINLSN